MTAKRNALCAAALSILWLVGCQAAPVTQNFESGIHVEDPKVYNTYTLSSQLDALRARLAAVSGIDQTSLIAHIGTLQGASEKQTQFSLQAAGPSLPSIATTATSGTPSVVQTTGTTNGTVTTTPSSTLSTVTTNPAMAPSVPTIASNSVAIPTTYGVSSLDALNEQMQLSYEITNLEMLLQGSWNDQFTEEGYPKQHLVLGFEINIETPPKIDSENVLAEVQVSVCNNDVSDSPDYLPEAPTVTALLPREKTYNVASITSDTTSIGAGAIISGIASVGGSFLSGNQTYYVVKDQDTLAFKRTPDATKCKSHNAKTNAATFAWQFRPVLGQRTVQQGMRQAFAELSLAPYTDPEQRIPVVIQTCWRRFDRKTGAVGQALLCQTDTKFVDRMFLPSIKYISTIDNRDGTVVANIRGLIPQGSYIRIGNTTIDQNTPGFEITGDAMRVPVPNQVAGLQEAELIGSEGTHLPFRSLGGTARWSGLQTASVDRNPGMPTECKPFPKFLSVAFQDDDLDKSAVLKVGTCSYAAKADGDDVVFDVSPTADMDNAELFQTGKSCKLPSDHVQASEFGEADVVPFSDTLVRVTINSGICLGVVPQQAYGVPPIVLLNGKVYGLSDTPFESNRNNIITLLAPKTLIQGQKNLTLKRLFASNAFTYRVPIKNTDLVTVTAANLLSSSKSIAVIGISGSELGSAKLDYPKSKKIEISADGTLMRVTLSASAYKNTKDLVLKPEYSAPILVAVPTDSAKPSSPALALIAHAAIAKGASGSYTIQGTALNLVTSVTYLGQQLPFSRSGDGNSLTIDQLPPGMTSISGTRELIVSTTDGSQRSFDVTISP
jgi:hypothetical protein